MTKIRICMSCGKMFKQTDLGHDIVHRVCEDCQLKMNNDIKKFLYE